jgi:hypothetical protein
VSSFKLYKKDQGRICNTSISLQITYGPNKLECYITPGCKGLPGTSTLAFWAHEESAVLSREYQTATHNNE